MVRFGSQRIQCIGTVRVMRNISTVNVTRMKKELNFTTYVYVCTVRNDDGAKLGKGESFFLPWPWHSEGGRADVNCFSE